MVFATARRDCYGTVDLTRVPITLLSGTAASLGLLMPSGRFTSALSCQLIHMRPSLSQEVRTSTFVPKTSTINAVMAGYASVTRPSQDQFLNPWKTCCPRCKKVDIHDVTRREQTLT